MKKIGTVLGRLIMRIMVLNVLWLGGQIALGEAEVITIVTEEFPPFNYTDSATGALTGFSTEIVQALLQELGIDAEIRSFPWARAYMMAEHQENVLIYSMKRTAKREALFKWIGALIKHESYFLTVKGSLIEPTTDLDIIKKYRIGAIRDGAIARGLKTDGFPTITLCADRDRNWELLKKGRIDLWCTEIVSARHIIKSVGDNPNDLKIIHRYEKLSQDFLYMAFSKQTDDTLVEKFRKGFNRLKKKKIYQEIFMRYGVSQQTD